MKRQAKDKSKNKDNTKVIPHIDARSLDEISNEVTRLKEQLKYNTMCLNLKKKELTDNKMKDEFKKIIDKPRKIFSFRINCDRILPDIQLMIQNLLNKILSEKKAKMTKAFFLNNFIWYKTNINIVMNMDNLQLENGMVMEQINPKDIIKLQ